MSRRITCCIIFVTLVWGAHTEDEEKVRDMFKSNLTRNDFSNLLNSLIKMNEQRVSVLHKLYRLEDYGVLSEVLRSGDKKTGSGNPNNVFLIVMSKNQNDLSSGRKVGFQGEDSVTSTSLDAGNKNIHPKLDFVLDPASFFLEHSQNIRKENRGSIFKIVPKVYIPTKIHGADDRIKKITTTTQMHKYNKLGLRAEVKPNSNVLRASKSSLKANADRKQHKENSRFEIVSNKGRHPNASETLRNGDRKSNKYPQTVGYNSQSNEYLEIDLTVKNDKLTTKQINIKHKLSRNHTNSKYPIEGNGEQDENDYGSPFNNIKNDRNRPYTKTDSDISIQKLHVHNHYNPEINKNTPKVKKVQINQKNDKLKTKQINVKHKLSRNHTNSKYPIEGNGEQDENDYGSPFNNIKNDRNRPYTKTDSDISIKKLHVHNHYNPEINKNTPKVKKVQNNQKNYKLKTKRITIKGMLSSNRPNTMYLLEDKDEPDEDYYGSPFSNIEIINNSQNTKIESDISIKNLHHNNPKTNKNTRKSVQRNQQNHKLSTKPIIIEDITTRNYQFMKYPLKDKEEQDEDYYGSPFGNIENDQNSQYTTINSDVSMKKLHVNNPKTNKNTPEDVLRNQENYKLSTKPIIIEDITTRNYQFMKNPIEDKDELDEDYYGSPFSNIENDHNSQYTNINSDDSMKKLHVNNPKINKNTPNIEFQSNQHLKLNKNTSNLNNEGNRYSKLKTAVDTTTPKNDYRIKYDTVNSNTASEINHSIKNVNNDISNANNNNRIYTTIKHKDATKGIDNNEFLTLASENDYGSNLAIPETTKDTPYGSYPGFEADFRDDTNKENLKTAKDTPTSFGKYPGFEDHKDVRDNSSKDKLKTNKNTPFGNFHGFEHHKNVMDNLNKDKPNTAKELHHGGNLNAESKKDTDYYGIKIFDNGKNSAEQFSVFITNVGNGTAKKVKQQTDPKLILNAFDQPDSKPIARKPFAKCLNKKAFKLCCKSCISAYKNVCLRLKCTSRSKKALKKECKRSCKKIFASSSSKYSNENSDENSDDNSDESSDENSDESSDESYSDDSS